MLEKKKRPLTEVVELELMLGVDSLADLCERIRAQGIDGSPFTIQSYYRAYQRYGLEWRKTLSTLSRKYQGLEGPTRAELNSLGKPRNPAFQAEVDAIYRREYSKAKYREALLARGGGQQGWLRREHGLPPLSDPKWPDREEIRERLRLAGKKEFLD